MNMITGYFSIGTNGSDSNTMSNNLSLDNMLNLGEVTRTDFCADRLGSLVKNLSDIYSSLKVAIESLVTQYPSIYGYSITLENRDILGEQYFIVILDIDINIDLDSESKIIVDELKISESLQAEDIFVDFRHNLK